MADELALRITVQNKLPEADDPVKRLEARVSKWGTANKENMKAKWVSFDSRCESDDSDVEPFGILNYVTFFLKKMHILHLITRSSIDSTNSN